MSRRLYAALALLTLCAGCGRSGESAAPAPAPPTGASPAATSAPVVADPAAPGPKAQAAHAFMVYYVKNVWAMPAICAEQGVPLTGYKARFVQVHAGMLKVASGVIDTDKAMTAVRPEAMEAARRELLDQATSDGKDAGFECSFIESNGAKIAESSDFSKTNAKTWAVLSQ